MIRACIVVDPFFQGNRLFALEDPLVNRDNCLYSYSVLRAGLREHGIDLKTQDLHSIESSEVVIFLDMPKSLPVKQPGQKHYLLALESVAVKPESFAPTAFALFDRVFTYRDDLLSPGRVVKIQYSFCFPNHPVSTGSSSQKQLCLIANNKNYDHPQDLTRERLRTIRWFDRHWPEEFRFFGSGWDDAFPHSRFQRIIRHLGIQSWFKKRRFRTYSGVCPGKSEVLQTFRFSLVFENVKDVPGYISEKIFDSLFAGCIPIYRGAGNITQFIPEDCFIDLRAFASLQELKDTLQSMKKERVEEYHFHIARFLAGVGKERFSSEVFAETVVSELKADRVFK